MPNLATQPLLVLAVGFFIFPGAAGGDETVDGVEDIPAHKAILGEWVRYQDTPNGRYMTIKEHRRGSTIVTTFDPDNKAVYSHQSDYVVDETGEALIFRYNNKVFLVGPNAGARDNREHAYIFRATKEKFFEVHGMLPQDTRPPTLNVWERLKDNPLPKPEA